jgi:putative ABC transport system ATP-binding protein
MSIDFATNARRDPTPRTGDTAAAPPVIELAEVSKSFERGGESTVVLDRMSLEVDPGTFEALMGPSGSGKSTVLNLVAGLDRPTSGRISVAGVELGPLSNAELARYRASTIGFVYQSFNLIKVLTALENVELPLLLAPLTAAQRKERARTALRIVGLEDRVGHFPRQLSGGQEQRVAIARAIVSDPPILIADEPTGDLDRKSADDVLELFERLHRDLGKTILMVTHDPLAAARASCVHRLEKGRLA